MNDRAAAESAGGGGGGGERVVAAVGVSPAGQQVECQRLRCAAVSAKASVEAHPSCVRAYEKPLAA